MKLYIAYNPLFFFWDMIFNSKLLHSALKEFQYYYILDAIEIDLKSTFSKYMVQIVTKKTKRQNNACLVLIVIFYVLSRFVN